jgi:hypothetical protein
VNQIITPADPIRRDTAPRAQAVTPGQVVLRTFKLAELRRGIGIAESTAWRWAQPRPRGTGGVVPSGYHLALLRLAHQLDRPLTADDLVLGRAD